MAKKVSNFRMWEGEKVSSNFQEIFNWEKAIEQNKNKNKNQTNAFCLPFIVFFTQNS